MGELAGETGSGCDGLGLDALADLELESSVAGVLAVGLGTRDVDRNCLGALGSAWLRGLPSEWARHGSGPSIVLFRYMVF